MNCPFTFDWMEVTPARAEEWLKLNRHNRHLRLTAVESFAADMRRGAWSPNHQGIAFGADGALLDGQHRLAAVVEAQAPIWTLVFRGIPAQVPGVSAKVMETIDRGNARSIGDLLKLDHGYAVEGNIAAAACLAIARVCVDSARRAKKATMPQTVAVLHRFRDGLKAALEIRRLHTARSGLRSSTYCAAVAFAHGLRPELAVEFYARFCDGAGLTLGSPVLTLRNYALENPAGHGGAESVRETVELTLHALHCFVKKEKMGRIPPPGARTGADWWRSEQAETVAAIAALFPVESGKKTCLMARRMATEESSQSPPAPPPPAPAHPAAPNQSSALRPPARVPLKPVAAPDPKGADKWKQVYREKVAK